MENKLKKTSVISTDKILKSEKFDDFYFNHLGVAGSSLAMFRN